MTHVVTEACIRCKCTDCVSMCPVDAFREGPNFLVIDPEECIDCTLCVAACRQASREEAPDVPRDQQHMTEINAELARSPNYKTITKRKDPLPDADEWKDRTDKLAELKR